MLTLNNKSLALQFVNNCLMSGTRANEVVFPLRFAAGTGIEGNPYAQQLRKNTLLPSCLQILLIESIARCKELNYEIQKERKRTSTALGAEILIGPSLRHCGLSAQCFFFFLEPCFSIGSYSVADSFFSSYKAKHWDSASHLRSSLSPSS
jgi:hypothetical protein